MQMSLEENMRSTGKRCPFKLTYKVGCSADGHITAVSGTVYSENWETPTDFAEDYDVPNWSVSGVQCNTMTYDPSFFASACADTFNSPTTSP